MRHFIATNITERSSRNNNFTKWEMDIFERKQSGYLPIKMGLETQYSDHEQNIKLFLCDNILAGKSKYGSLAQLSEYFSKKADLFIL